MKARTCWFSVCAVLVLAPWAWAQTVYTWKDGSGVVHFSDENPEGVKGVETLNLESPQPIVSETEGEGGGQASVTPAAGAPEGGAEGGGQQNSDAPKGPAEVVYQGANLVPMGPTQRQVKGRLRNVGGLEATAISVRVVVADGDTGNLCMTVQLQGDPHNLGPGESGGFSGELDTPCFYGNPKISYYPEWD